MPVHAMMKITMVTGLLLLAVAPGCTQKEPSPAPAAASNSAGPSTSASGSTGTAGESTAAGEPSPPATPAPVDPQHLTWTQLAQHPDRWPPVTAISHPITLEDGTRLEQGHEVLVVRVHPQVVDVLLPGGAIVSLGPEDCDLLERANAAPPAPADPPPPP